MTPEERAAASEWVELWLPSLRDGRIHISRALDALDAADATLKELRELAQRVCDETDEDRAAGYAMALAALVLRVTTPPDEAEGSGT